MPVLDIDQSKHFTSLIQGKKPLDSRAFTGKRDILNQVDTVRIPNLVIEIEMTPQ